MPRVFAGHSQVEKTVETLIKIYSATGKLPDELVEAVRQALKSSYKSSVIYFYELLAEKCPEALKYFK